MTMVWHAERHVVHAMHSRVACTARCHQQQDSHLLQIDAEGGRAGGGKSKRKSDGGGREGGKERERGWEGEGERVGRRRREGGKEREREGDEE